MKKDSNLEKAFDEYFEAGTPPRSSVTDGAKNLINTPSIPRRINAALRRALIAAACAATAALSAVGLYFSPTFIGNLADTVGDNSQAQTPQPPQSQQIEYYAAEGLEMSEIDPYSADAPSGLDFVKKLEHVRNYSVNTVDGYSSDNSLAYVKAECSALVNACRHDAVIYAEYTQKYSVCELFEEYYSGSAKIRYGYEYLILETENNGEPCKMVTVEKGEIKYYLSVTGTDDNAYLLWLDLIIN